MESVLSAPALLVRTFEKKDLESVTSLMRELNYPTTLNVMGERMEMMASSPIHCNMIAELEGRVVGMVMLRQIKSLIRHEPVTQITSLIVTSSCRNQGIGKRLVRDAEAWGKQQGSHLLFLKSGNPEELDPAHAFFEHIGFEKAGYKLVKQL
ncbi:GNAT family N-acetyltransferase [Paenibacillus faecalis]|uniref:GNAT family N-acetyltransferase n=1 Tax=Paenibacillus faecalis TaxID=2079532 RepID=UPI001F2D991C|nr:GNAT family N-acetyltransferase [Paenibacillus faecalis]